MAKLDLDAMAVMGRSYDEAREDYQYKTQAAKQKAEEAERIKAANTSGITPMEYNVLVKPTDVEEKTAGGIFIPQERLEKDEFGRINGTLVAVSAGAFTDHYYGWPEDAQRPKVGDSVLFSKYSATEVTGKDGGKYWLMKDRDIAGVMQDD